MWQNVVFALQQWLRERASMVHYTYVACLVSNTIVRFSVSPRSLTHYHRCFAIFHLTAPLNQSHTKHILTLICFLFWHHNWMISTLVLYSKCPSSNFSGCSYTFLAFPRSFKITAMILPPIRPHLLSSKPFSFHYSLMIKILYSIGCILTMSLQQY